MGFQHSNVFFRYCFRSFRMFKSKPVANHPWDIKSVLNQQMSLFPVCKTGYKVWTSQSFTYTFEQHHPLYYEHWKAGFCRILSVTPLSDCTVPDSLEKCHHIHTDPCRGTQGPEGRNFSKSHVHSLCGSRTGIQLF